MATTQAPLTPTSDTSPAIASLSQELSGPQWVSRFPTGTSISDCVDPFKSNLERFYNSMIAAGASVHISATFRPPGRAYLMHWCYEIANSDQDPRSIPPMQGVLIRWDHTNSDGTFNLQASREAARAMVNGYGMQNLNTSPALISRHTARCAVDMTISWLGDLEIDKSDGTAMTITSTPRNGMNPDLKVVGAGYGVKKYIGGAADKPHWSDNGH